VRRVRTGGRFDSVRPVLPFLIGRGQNRPRFASLPSSCARQPCPVHPTLGELSSGRLIFSPAFFRPSSSHRATPRPHHSPLSPAITAASAPPPPPNRSRDARIPLQIAASLSCYLQRGAGTPRLAPDLLLLSLICAGFAVWP
jgi:hypothetical protein